MSKRYQTDCCSGSSSSFIFGLLIGAVIGALVAIFIYKNNKTKIFEELQLKLQDFFQKILGSASETGQIVPKKSKSKIEVVVDGKTILVNPQRVTNKDPVFVVPKKSKPKTFIGSKK